MAYHIRGVINGRPCPKGIQCAVEQVFFGLEETFSGFTGIRLIRSEPVAADANGQTYIG